MSIMKSMEWKSHLSGYNRRIILSGGLIMNSIITNTEFQEAFSNLTFHYVPDGYWDRINEKRKKHKYVGKKHDLTEG